MNVPPSIGREPGHRIGRVATALAVSAVAAVAVCGCQITDLITATPLPTTDESPAVGWGWHVSAAERRGANGQIFEYVCPPDGGLSDIWGTDVYTDDSSICTAAVHSGLLRRETGGRVRILVQPGREQYEGSTRNGIVSADYGYWDGSFVFILP